MSIADKLTEIAENEQKVYDNGYSKAESDMWDMITNRGERTFYEGAFQCWGSNEYIRPKHKVVSGIASRNINIFSNNPSLKKIESKYFDFSAFTPSLLYNSEDANIAVFRNCPQLEEIEDVGIQGGGYLQTYAECPKLKTVKVMRCVRGASYSAVFNNDVALENITVEGEIERSITFAFSPLSIESLKSVIRALVNHTGTNKEFNYTITFHPSCLDLLSNEGKTSPDGTSWTDYIYSKGWNLG